MPDQESPLDWLEEERRLLVVVAEAAGQHHVNKNWTVAFSTALGAWLRHQESAPTAYQDVTARQA